MTRLAQSIGRGGPGSPHSSKPLQRTFFAEKALLGFSQNTLFLGTASIFFLREAVKTFPEMILLCLLAEEDD